MAWDRTKQPELMTYQSYCTFVYTHMIAGTQYTIYALFPPLGREDVYGSMTETEIRTLAFKQLSNLEQRYGNVKVIKEDQPNETK